MIDTIRSVYGRYQIGRRELDDIERARRTVGFQGYIESGGLLSVDVDFYRLRAAMPEMQFRATAAPAAVCYCWYIRKGDVQAWGDSQAEAMRELVKAMIREV